MFVGRYEELLQLEKLYNAKSAQLAVLYGRRRIGKSVLIEEFCKNKSFLRFEGLENEQTLSQIRQFSKDLGKQINDPILTKARLSEWTELLDKLTEVLQQRKERTVVFMDEFQWLAVQHSLLVSLFKKYWDQRWKKCNVVFILCGSVSSFMVKKIIKSKALYGRINLELHLDSLSPVSCQQLLKKRTHFELLNYYLVFGGVPKYWEEILSNRSFEQNLNELFFKPTGFLFNDYERIFYSQFKEYSTYEQLVRTLNEGPASLEEIAKKMKMLSGGGLKFYLENLELAGFIHSYVPYDKRSSSKLKKYSLIDEYLRFYLKFVEPNKKIISVWATQRNFFQQIIKAKWDIWAGFAFENFCRKQAFLLADKMGFADYVESFGPYFSRGDKAFQVDLIFRRTDKVITLCEIKYQNKPISTQIIAEVKRKCELIKVPRGYNLEKALITTHGVDQALRDSEFFEHILQIEDYF